MKKFSILLILFFIVSFFPNIVEAKLLPQVSKLGSISKTNTNFYVSPRLRSDRRALIVYFANLESVSNVSYLLTYQTNVQEEGAMGGLKSTNTQTDTEELLFGTCSKNVCTYHKGITNMHLEVSYTSKSGKKYLKKYRIKV